MRSLVLSVCALAASASSVAASQFTTVGSKIYDPNGNEFIARGVNIPGYNFWTGHDPVPDVSKIADDWRFNFVRANALPTVPWKSWGGNISDAAIVDAFTNRGPGKDPVTVMFAVHPTDVAYLEGEELTAATDYFVNLVRQNKDNPYVWFNLMNEPRNKANDGSPGWDIWTPDRDKWLHMHQTMIKAIRDEEARLGGVKHVIVADGTNWGQDQAWDDLGNLNRKHSAILSFGKELQNFDGQSYDNIVFSTHLYGEWSARGAVPERLEKYIQAVQAEGLPLIFGEYGATIWGDWLKVAEESLKVARKYGVGRAAWHWADAGGWDLTTGIDPTVPADRSWSTGGGYLIDDLTNPTNLTPFGQLVWSDSHAILPVPEPTAGLLIFAGATLALTRRQRRAA